MKQAAADEAPFMQFYRYRAAGLEAAKGSATEVRRRAALDVRAQLRMAGAPRNKTRRKKIMDRYDTRRG